MIRQFSGEYRFLSNFYTSPFIKDGIFYLTVEHYYQSMKAKTIEERKKIAAADTPGRAKRLGQNCDIREDWEDVKVDIMKQGLELKFKYHPFLKRQLLATGNKILVEGNTWGDTFWGICNGTGRNVLGELLMEERDRLKNEIHN